MCTTPFNPPWGGGQVGYIYADIDRIKRVLSLTDGKEALEMAKSILRSEVAVYDSYLRNDVYGYRLVKTTACGKCGHKKEDEPDSCWGFYGMGDWDVLKDNIEEEYVHLVDKLEIVKG